VKMNVGWREARQAIGETGVWLWGMAEDVGFRGLSWLRFISVEAGRRKHCGKQREILPNRGAVIPAELSRPHLQHSALVNHGGLLAQLAGWIAAPRAGGKCPTCVLQEWLCGAELMSLLCTSSKGSRVHL